MNDKEYTYDIDKYTIGVDENGEDGFGMTIVKIENGGIKFLGNCYGENARCIDLLIKENQELKKQLEEERNKVREYSYKLSNFRCEETYENQQKEFIEYLEDLIKQNETVVEVSKYGLPKICSKLLIDFYKEILSKYKEIIGDDK